MVFGQVGKCELRGPTDGPDDFFMRKLVVCRRGTIAKSAYNCFGRCSTGDRYPCEGILAAKTKAMKWAAIALVIVALISSIGLLARDAGARSSAGFSAAAVSSLPLLAVGISFLVIQPLLRPRPVQLAKNVLLAATFLLWGCVQLMEANSLSKTLGDVVIALYVVDLAWTVLARVIPAET